MGRTKALIEIDGIPMGARVAAALDAAGCARVIAYGGDPDELASLGISVVADQYPGAGPLGAVLGVLELLEGQGGNVLEVFVVACDLPALAGPELGSMIDAARRHATADVVVARTTDIEPACAIWRVSATRRIRDLFDGGERALHEAIGRLEAVEVDVDPDALRNINTPDDLGRYP